MEKIDLEYPIKASGTEVKALHMRRPKCRDLLAIEKEGGTDAEQEFRLFANLTEIAPGGTAGAGHGPTISKLQEVYAGFFVASARDIRRAVRRLRQPTPSKLSGPCWQWT